jgi:ribonuclease HI
VENQRSTSICSDSQAALKALKAIRTMPFLVYQCQKVLNDISALHDLGLYWVPGHAGVRGNENANGLARCGSASRFVGPEPALGVSRQDLRNKISLWLVNQHWRQW